MKLDYPQKDNGIYVLRKEDFDDIAFSFLREYLPSVIDVPKEVDVNYLAKECLYLDIISKYICADKSTLGLIAFADTNIPYYDLHFIPQTMHIKEGTIVIDLSLSGKSHTPRRRFTLAHEMSHWILHRSYHSPTNQAYEFRKIRGDYLACRDSMIASNKKVLETESVWEERQADSLAAAILMPKFAFLQYACGEIRRICGENITAISEKINPSEYKCVVHNISETFNVSLKAVEIRLSQFDLVYG